MGLKSFHLFFIGACVVLMAFIATWAAGQYRALNEAQYLVTAIGTGLTGAALIVYGAVFQRKARRL